MLHLHCYSEQIDFVGVGVGVFITWLVRCSPLPKNWQNGIAGENQVYDKLNMFLLFSFLFKWERHLRTETSMV